MEQELWIKVDECRYETRERYPDDEWDNGDTDATIEVVSLHLSPQPYPFDNVTYPKPAYGVKPERADGAVDPLVVGDVVWLLYCVYGTGSTFGRQGGNFAAMMVTRDKWKALAWTSDPNSFTNGGAPWIGYFEWLDYVGASEMIIEP